jgi:Immunoglobulin-like domain of bacterial spore germination
MTVMARRIAVALPILFAVAAAACGSSTKQTNPANTTTSSAPAASSTSSSVTSSTVPATTTTTPQTALPTAVWPTAASNDRYNDPVIAARAFATGYMHFVNPIVGPFQQGDARSGEVAIRPVSGGPITTVIVRQFGTDDSWWVLGAATPHINIAQPAAFATITSPVRLRGTSTAFEATVQVSIRQDDNSKALAESFLTGGANGQMGPFDATFRFARPTSRYGAVVLYNISSDNGHVLEATVIRVRLSPT